MSVEIINENQHIDAMTISKLTKEISSIKSRVAEVTVKVDDVLRDRLVLTSDKLSMKDFISFLIVYGEITRSVEVSDDKLTYSYLSSKGHEVELRVKYTNL